MVLRVKWLQNFEYVTLSYKDQNVKLSTEGKVWEFQGIQAGEMELVQAESMDKSVYQSTKGWVMYVCSKKDNPITHPKLIHPFMRVLCEKNKDICKEVIRLPPKITDHQISLMPSAGPVNLRPYGHPWEQKNVIEKNDKRDVKCRYYKE